MSYIDNNLVAGERVVHRAHLHWMVFGGGAFWFLLFLITLAAGAGAAAAGCLVLGLIVGAFEFLNYKTSEFAVTNRRIIMKSGVIRRRSLELFLAKVESVSVDQSIAGRIFGFGTVVVGGSGGTREPFPKVGAPLALRKAVNEQMGAMAEGGLSLKPA